MIQVEGTSSGKEYHGGEEEEERLCGGKKPQDNEGQHLGKDFCGVCWESSETHPLENTKSSTLLVKISGDRFVFF